MGKKSNKDNQENDETISDLSAVLSDLQEAEVIHLELEFADFKLIYPQENKTQPN